MLAAGMIREAAAMTTPIGGAAPPSHKPGPLPLLLRVQLDFERDAQMSWPELVVPLMVDAGAGSAAQEPSFFTPPTGGG